MLSFKSLRLPLGAYQSATFSSLPEEDYEQFGPNPLLVNLVSPMITPFTNDHCRLILSEESQRHLILILEANLNPNSEAAKRVTTELAQLPYAELVS